MFKKFDVIMVPVENMKKAVEFYKDVVGLELEYESEDWSEFQGGDVSLGLHLANKGELRKGPVIGFHVKDIEETVKKLEEKGAKCVQEIKKMPAGFRYAEFIDNDGHRIGIAER